MKNKQAFTLMEILVVISIIAVLAGILYPAIGAVIAMVKTSLTEGRIAVLSQALETYSADFSGFYPPDTIDSSPVNIQTGNPLENGSQALCYFLESSCMNDDGSLRNFYHEFAPKEKKKGGRGTQYPNINIGGGNTGTVSEDYIIDYFGGPVLYDERKSEGTREGLNSQSYILISGGRRDKNAAVTAAEFEKNKGVWPGPFTPEELGTIDTVPADYDKAIPPDDLNDDIMNR